MELSNSWIEFFEIRRGSHRSSRWITFSARIFSEIYFVRIQAALEPLRSNPQLRYIPTKASGANLSGDPLVHHLELGELDMGAQFDLVENRLQFRIVERIMAARHGVRETMER